MMISRSKCESCTEETKFISGFADQAESGGPTFNCLNEVCFISRDRNEYYKKKELAKKDIQSKYSLSVKRMEIIEEFRRAKKLSIYSACKHLRIKPVQYCKYRGHEEKLPEEIWQKFKMLRETLDYA